MTRKILQIIGLAFLLAISGCWQSDVGRSYYPSGKIRTDATVRNGLLDGPATMFYESGTKMSEANYRAGLLDGKAFSFYESGSKKSTAEYKQGLLHGKSANWKEDGSIIDEVTFVEGSLVPRGDNVIGQKKDVVSE